MDLSGLKGQVKPALYCAAFSCLCFILGVGDFPLSLASILAGMALVLLCLGRPRLRSWFAFAALFLHTLRVLLGGFGTDMLSFFYSLACLIAAISLLFYCGKGLKIVVIERDDAVLTGFIMKIIAPVCFLICLADFFRGLSLGFAAVTFRLGSAAFWLSLTLYYLRVRLPKMPDVRALYAGRAEHPYHRLGGTILIFVIGVYIVSAALLIVGPILVKGSLDALRAVSEAETMISDSAVLSSSRVFLMLLVVFSFLMTLSAFMLLWLARKIRMRSEYFLLYFEYACILVIVLSVLLLVFGGHYLAAFLLFVALAAAVYGLMYFLSTSVHVRTCMASDGYLRKAWFTKKLPSPVPADEAL